jgi:riboflavin kinase/FMN adenylyltransferase
LVPANGVYAITAQLQNETLKGMLNIGVRPTVEVQGERTVEANLFGLDREIYGETLRVRFVERLRDEIRFSGLDALKAQLNIDREQARAALASIAAS